LTGGLLGTLGDCLTLVGILVVMGSMHLQLTLITCLIVPLMAGLTAYWRTRARSAFQQVGTTLGQVSAGLQEHIAGVRVIQSLGSEATAEQQFARLNGAYLAAHLAANRLSALCLPGIELLGVLGIALVLVYGSPLVLAGQLSAGSLVAFVLYVQRFFEPMRDLALRWNTLHMAMAAGARLVDVLETPVQLRDAPRPVVRRHLRGEVEFRHVWFQYQPTTPVLRDISLHVPAGQHLAIVGPTGAGKTTLVNLVARFYDVTAGAILIDGVDVRALAQDDLRRQIGMVLQEPWLCSGTVRDNLRYGNPTASDAAMAAAARAIGAHDLIVQLPHGYDTEVHERGSLLSYGQRQLISFVRALLANPRLIILDEATASLDLETECLVQAGLRALLRNRTAFIIAHRLSTVRHADRILVLEQGGVAASGTHDELLQQGGLYARLYAMI
jgi:ATP-binding cassette subfamily B protein